MKRKSLQIWELHENNNHLQKKSEVQNQKKSFKKKKPSEINSDTIDEGVKNIC